MCHCSTVSQRGLNRCVSPTVNYICSGSKRKLYDFVAIFKYEGDSQQQTWELGTWGESCYFFSLLPVCATVRLDRTFSAGSLVLQEATLVQFLNALSMRLWPFLRTTATRNSTFGSCGLRGKAAILIVPYGRMPPFDYFPERKFSTDSLVFHEFNQIQVPNARSMNSWPFWKTMLTRSSTFGN